MPRVPVVSRRIEAYRLTISGLPEGTDYGTFLKGLMDKNPDRDDRIMRSSGKYHLLLEVKKRSGRVTLRFASYKKGYRPDVYDERSGDIQPSPLSEDQTTLEYTHALFIMKEHGAVMSVERNYFGLWVSTMEGYLQWLVHETERRHRDTSLKGVTVSIDPIPDPTFREQLDGLDRIRAVYIRLSRPNPDWDDIAEPLDEGAKDSGAQRVIVGMTAPRNESLNRQKGIVGWVKRLLTTDEPFTAQVEGKKDGKDKTLDTKKEVKHLSAELRADENGQVAEESAFTELARLPELNE